MNCTPEMLRLYAVTDRAWVGAQTLPQQVEAALKGGYRLPRQAANDQVSGVARHSGAGEMGDVGIGEDGFILHGIHQAAQAAAQDHTAGGPQGAVGEDVVGGALNGFVEIGHKWASFD